MEVLVAGGLFGLGVGAAVHLGVGVVPAVPVAAGVNNSAPSTPRLPPHLLLGAAGPGLRQLTGAISLYGSLRRGSTGSNMVKKVTL